MDRTTPHPAPAQAAPLTVEEGRLGAALAPGGRPVAEQLLFASGLHRLVDAFSDRLDAAASIAEAAAVAQETGRQVWETAVARAQGRSSEPTTGRCTGRGRR